MLRRQPLRLTALEIVRSASIASMCCLALALDERNLSQADSRGRHRHCVWARGERPLRHQDFGRVYRASDTEGPNTSIRASRCFPAESALASILRFAPSLYNFGTGALLSRH